MLAKIFDGFFLEIFPSIFAFVTLMGFMLISGVVLKVKDIYEKKKSNNTISDKVCGI